MDIVCKHIFEKWKVAYLLSRRQFHYNLKLFKASYFVYFLTEMFYCCDTKDKDISWYEKLNYFLLCHIRLEHRIWWYEVFEKWKVVYLLSRRQFHYNLKLSKASYFIYFLTEMLYCCDSKDKNICWYEKLNCFFCCAT